MKSGNKIYLLIFTMVMLLGCLLPMQAGAVGMFHGGAFGVGASPTSVTTADFNGDGFADMAVANDTSGNVSVLLGDGAGGFVLAVNYAVGVNPQSVTTADFNGDGFTDMAVANWGSNNVSVLLGDGTLWKSMLVYIEL